METDRSAIVLCVDGAMAFTVTGGMSWPERDGGAVPRQQTAMIRSLVLALGSIGSSVRAQCAVRADVIMLRGGGQVQGKVVPDAQDKDRVQVWLLQGKNRSRFRSSRYLR